MENPVTSDGATPESKLYIAITAIFVNFVVAVIDYRYTFALVQLLLQKDSYKIFSMHTWSWKLFSAFLFSFRFASAGSMFNELILFAILLILSYRKKSWTFLSLNTASFLFLHLLAFNNLILDESIRNLQMWGSIIDMVCDIPQIQASHKLHKIPWSAGFSSTLHALRCALFGKSLFLESPTFGLFGVIGFVVQIVVLTQAFLY